MWMSKSSVPVPGRTYLSILTHLPGATLLWRIPITEIILLSKQVIHLAIRNRTDNLRISFFYLQYDSDGLFI